MKLLVITFIILFVIAIIVLSAILMHNNEKYSMTLGMYGQPEPKECSEKLPGLRYPHLYTCKACGLECSTLDSQNNCRQCLQILNERYAGIL